MKTLVLGATGATGRFLVKDLLQRGIKVTAVVRSPEKLTSLVGDSDLLEVVAGTVLEFDNQKIQALTSDCDTVASCLGHNISFRGLFGKPHKLVRDSAKKVCDVLMESSSSQPIKYVLMNSTAVIKTVNNEKPSFAESLILSVLRLLLPPHTDNEAAARYFIQTIGSSFSIQWCVVRPDSLIDKETSPGYDAHPKAISSPIFSAGKVSRITVAKFMADLIEDNSLWDTWKGKAPVLYDSRG